MNYLGHAYLTPKNSDLLIGNYLGDHVKGKLKERYPEFIQQGIRLHRFIDHYTDTHKIVRSHCELMEKDLGHLSGVAMDMLYDHVLGKNWSDFSDIPLEEYSQKVFAECMNYKKYFPEKFEFMFRYMRRDNWLMAYATEEGILRALNGLSRRIRFENNLPDCFPLFLKHEEEITEGYFEFMKDIQNEIRQQFS